MRPDTGARLATLKVTRLAPAHPNHLPISGPARRACGTQPHVINVWVRAWRHHSPREWRLRFSDPLSGQSGALDGLDHDGGEAVLKPESFPIDRIYVPVKRRKTLKPEVVQEIAESMLEIGQQTPILVRADEDRLVLVEGLHRLEACKALGEGAIVAVLVSAEEAHEKTHSDPGLVAEREKMERLRKLRLEKEATDKLAAASKAASPAEATLRQREQPKTTIRSSPKAGASRSGRGAQGSAPATLSDWIKQQERNGGRY